MMHLGAIPAKAAAFIPITALVTSRTPTRAKYSLPVSELGGRRTLRTVMFGEAGVLTDAQINLQTGEVTAHAYEPYYPQRTKARAKAEPSDIEPPWVRIPAPPRCLLQLGAFDKSRKKVVNSIQMYLVDHMTLDEALVDLPLLDNLIVGAARLDLGGNSRPLSSSLLFALLKNLDVITPITVRDFRGCSERHSQKLAQALRIIIAAFNAEANKLSTG